MEILTNYVGFFAAGVFATLLVVAAVRSKAQSNENINLKTNNEKLQKMFDNIEELRKEDRALARQVLIDYGGAFRDWSRSSRIAEKVDKIFAAADEKIKENAEKLKSDKE